MKIAKYKDIWFHLRVKYRAVFCEHLVPNTKILYTYSMSLTNRRRASQPLIAAWIMTADCSRFFSIALSSRAAFVCSRNVSLVVSDLENILLPIYCTQYKNTDLFRCQDIKQRIHIVTLLLKQWNYHFHSTS